MSTAESAIAKTSKETLLPQLSEYKFHRFSNLYPSPADRRNQMTAPKFDWNLEIFDTWSDGIINLETLDAEDAPKMLVPLSLLPIGAIPETDDSWQDNYDKESTFPPVILEVCSDSEWAIIDGNHRVIMWRKWGFTHAPALVTHAEMLDLTNINGPKAGAL